MIDYQLSQIAIMHFENGRSQQEISNILGISKMTVSRMLQKAKDQNIVQISVKLPFSLDSILEDKLKEAFGLDSVRVVKRETDPLDYDQDMDFTAKAAAFFLNTNPPSNTTIGIGIGRTISRLVDQLLPIKTEKMHIVQLMGGLPEVSTHNPFSIVQEICRKWASQGTFLTSFATAENKNARDNFFHNTDTGKMVYALWGKCNQAILSVGTIENGTLLSPQLVGLEETNTLKEKKAIGDILGHCFTSQGKFIQSDLEDRLLSIPIDKLLMVKKRLCVATGKHKAKALVGALRTGAITELITDSLTAVAVLDLL